MKHFTLLSGILFLLQTATLFATTYTSVQDGDWNDPSTWSPAGVPNTSSWPGDHVNIAHDITVTQDLTFTQGAGFNILSEGHLNSSKNITINYTTGTYNIASGGTLTFDELTHNASGITIYAEGSIFGTKMTLNSHFQSSGKITLSDILIKASSNVVLSNSDLNLSGDLQVIEGGSLTASATPIYIAGNFYRSGGGALSISDSSVDIIGYMDLGTSNQLPFDGVLMNIGSYLKVSGGATMQIDGNSNVTVTGNINLLGSGSIHGINDGGILAFGSISITGGGSCVQCVSGSCDYPTGTTPPSPFDLSTCAGSGLLPVEFLYFTAESKANDTELNWATASEIDNDYFIVQQSADGKTWNDLTEIFGQGTTTQTTSYQYTDSERYNTTVSYYRLIQVDFDGTENYSDIVVVNRQLDNDPVNEINIEVFPNPATDHFTLKIMNEDLQPNIQLRDMIGQPVSIQVSNNGTLNHVILPAGLTSGTYFLVVSEGKTVTTKKIFIK